MVGSGGLLFNGYFPYPLITPAASAALQSAVGSDVSHGAPSLEAGLMFLTNRL
jgi:hypothetical protein